LHCVDARRVSDHTPVRATTPKGLHITYNIARMQRDRRNRSRDRLGQCEPVLGVAPELFPGRPVGEEHVEVALGLARPPKTSSNLAKRRDEQQEGWKRGKKVFVD
jgi:hypothetical protein